MYELQLNYSQIVWIFKRNELIFLHHKGIFDFRWRRASNFTGIATPQNCVVFWVGDNLNDLFYAPSEEPDADQGKCRNRW